jgi:hypothetical protein
MRRQHPCFEMPLIFDDVTEVITLMASFSQVVVISYLPPHIIVHQTASAASLRARLTQLLPIEGSHRGLPTDLSTMMRSAASIPYCANAMIVRSHMTLKYRFRFWIIPWLGVRALDTSDLLMVGYLLELLCDGSLIGATIKIRRPSPVESTQVLILILG